MQACEPGHRPTENHRIGQSCEEIKQSFLDNLYYTQGRFLHIATPFDCYMALSFAVRDRMVERWLHATRTYQQQKVRMVCYLSAEFLLGPHLANNILNLGIEKETRLALGELGLDLDRLTALEPEPGLGNGGLGRLAACFMESLATLEIPAIGYGIRYEFGIFQQEIRSGWQLEVTDKWLDQGNPWEIARPSSSVYVKFGGKTSAFRDVHGRYRVLWAPDTVVRGVPYDTPIAGYGNNTANTLRLWKAEAHESFDFDRFNTGDYLGAVREKIQSENITKVLYPNDEKIEGKNLRLEQQYFFTSCALQDILRRHSVQGRDLKDLDQYFAIQMNDTHPSIAVAELMRLLIDDNDMDWDSAWRITQNCLGYTNHTLLPEALERWSLPLFGALLPRHLEIIFEINQRFLNEVRLRFPGDEDRVRRMSLIDESGERFVRMAHLAAAGSHAINGVAALHTELLERDTLHDFYELSPQKFSNKTNGVTPRRWLALSNPQLAAIITEHIGDGWIRDLNELRRLEPLAEDEHFRHLWRHVNHATKIELARFVQDKTGVELDPTSIFDIQVKRLHEYKRQHLNVLHIITLYRRFLRDPQAMIMPRSFLFAGKAAPGYHMAKLIIKLINSVGDVVNNDPVIDGRLKVAFIPDYNVSVAQRIYPAADVSEQISTAGKEASGTSNMKFCMNGALTVGTLDGANIEIRDEVGHENFFLFGLTTPEVYAAKAAGYSPRSIYESNWELREVIDSIANGDFSSGDREVFRPLIDSLMNRDEYMLFADYASYIACQEHVSAVFHDEARWARMSILNTARSGKFSSDRTIAEYCKDIWQTNSVHVQLETPMDA